MTRKQIIAHMVFNEAQNEKVNKHLRTDTMPINLQFLLVLDNRCSEDFHITKGVYSYSNALNYITSRFLCLKC